ncbi:hypothetical protein BJ508DRAFT_411422 [Ascobolus immersus RN42]|uniref:Required for respiratory growth protein 9, mitochondrial n=1 Tax=Ascobolus immersus RN42 TaxID=1160509 RepID=A0A3N4IX73_ASCIM|nr:hypothetical protein BJ508DRAFT_411422 [Ascobolus immersus RN42]
MPLPTHASPTLALARIFLRHTLTTPVILPILHPALYRLSPLHSQIRTIIKRPRNPHPTRREHWEDSEIDGYIEADEHGNIPFVEGKVTTLEMRRRGESNREGMKAYFVDGNGREGRRYRQEPGRSGMINRFVGNQRPHEEKGEDRRDNVQDRRDGGQERRGGFERGGERRGPRIGFSGEGNMEIDKDGFVKDVPDRAGKSIDELARMDRKRYGRVATNPNWSEAMDRIQEIRSLQHEHEGLADFMDQYEAGEIVDVEAPTPPTDQQQQSSQTPGVASVAQAQKLMAALTETPGSSLFKAKEEQEFQDRKALKSKSSVDKELPFQTDSLISSAQEANPDDQPYELPEEQIRFEETLSRLAQDKPIKTKPLPPLPETDWRGSTKKEIFKRLPEWLKHKYTMQKKLMGRAWRPRKKLSPDVMDAIRELQDRFPDMMMTPVLAEQFGVSIESIRRILKGGRWKPTPEEQEERMARWARRGEIIRQAKIQAGQWTSKENDEFEKRQAGAKKLGPKKEKKEKPRMLNSMESKKEAYMASERRMSRSGSSFFEDKEAETEQAREPQVEVYEVDESPKAPVFDTVSTSTPREAREYQERPVRSTTRKSTNTTEKRNNFPPNVTFAPPTESSSNSSKPKVNSRYEEHQETLQQLDFWRKRSGVSETAPWDKRARYGSNPAEIYRDREEKKKGRGRPKKKEMEVDTKKTEAELDRLVQEEDVEKQDEDKGYRVRNRML